MQTQGWGLETQAAAHHLPTRTWDGGASPFWGWQSGGTVSVHLRAGLDSKAALQGWDEGRARLPLLRRVRSVEFLGGALGTKQLSPRRCPHRVSL